MVLKHDKISDVNECERFPELCENNSTCVDTFGDYNCMCLHGYSGKNCQLGRFSYNAMLTLIPKNNDMNLK